MLQRVSDITNRKSSFDKLAGLGVMVILAVCIELSAAEPPDAPFPGQKGDWHGFVKYDFQVDDKPVVVVTPEKPAPGRPWVWHGEFFGHKPDPDIAMLKRGFHIVYMSVPDMLGSPQAVAHWDAFYKELTEKYGFAKKAALVGLSRGGLYCYNWAAANPEKVACIYADAPVCDFKSWPGGKGKGKGSPRDWALVLKCYGFKNDAEALAYTKNPIDNLESLAKAKVPLLHVYGTADDVVPWDENTGLLAERYSKLGGPITLIAKEGIGHHPHGLKDSAPIVDFIAKHSLTHAVEPLAVEIVAHRGASFDAPENTVSALKLAWEQGADAAEFDIYLTQDGKIVACHDKDLKRTAGNNKLIVESTLDELRKLDFGSWKDAKFAGEKIPTLAEMLATVPQGKKVYIEVKCGPEIVSELLRELQATDLQPMQTPVISFNAEVIAAVKASRPAVPCYWLFGLKPETTAESLIQKAKEIHADGLDLSAKPELDQAFAAKVRAAGLRLDVWTVNEVDIAKRMIDIGAQGLTTDRPGWLREQLSAGRK